MKTLAQRLKIALDTLGLSQREAGKICGISQQSINYIITRDLDHSKLAATIASALNINPNWLIYGEGKFKEQMYYEIPVLNCAYEILKYLHGDLNENTTPTTTFDFYLGNIAFAYLLEPNKLAICCDKDYNYPAVEYLCIKELKVEISPSPTTTQAFSVIEWRLRSAEFKFDVP